MRKTILFSVFCLFLLTFQAFGAGRLQLFDDLSGVDLDRLGAMVTALEKKIDECEVKLQLAGQEIALTQQENWRYEKHKPGNVNRFLNAAIELHEAKLCITWGDRDLERLRAEILRRLSALAVSEPDPGQRQKIRDKLQGFKNQLGEPRRKVNELSAGLRHREQLFETLIAPVPVFLMDEPFSGNPELDGRIVQRLQSLGCGAEQLETNNLRPSDEHLDRLAGRIEELRGREGGEGPWYDVDVVQQFDRALEKAGGGRGDPQSLRAAVLALGARIWLILDSKK